MTLVLPLNKKGEIYSAIVYLPAFSCSFIFDLTEVASTGMIHFHITGKVTFHIEFQRFVQSMTQEMEVLHEFSILSSVGLRFGICEGE